MGGRKEKLNSLAQVLFILISPLFLYWQCTSKDRARQGRWSDGSTTIFNTVLVSKVVYCIIKHTHTPVTKSTLARWIKAVLVSSGIDISMYIPHSTRSVSTSAAVLKTAGWKKDCVFRKKLREGSDR